MQDLIELINIVTKQKVSQIEIITENAHTLDFAAGQEYFNQHEVPKLYK